MITWNGWYTENIAICGNYVYTGWYVGQTLYKINPRAVFTTGQSCQLKLDILLKYLINFQLVTEPFFKCLWKHLSCSYLPILCAFTYSICISSMELSWIQLPHTKTDFTLTDKIMFLSYMVRISLFREENMSAISGCFR